MLKKHTAKVLLSVLGLALMTSGPATAEGDAAAGAKVFNKCKTCHILTGPGKRMGPSLECVFGRTAGTVEGYRYSPAMAASGIVWDESTMTEYLKSPRTYIPKNKMSFIGLKKEADRDNLIAYLRANTSG